MKRALVAVMVGLVGCGSPAAPTTPPTPPPPVYPSMLGGWGGTTAATWVSTDATVTGSRTCNETWLITAQSDGSFSGAFQSTPGTSAVCAVSGDIRGTVGLNGSLTLGQGNTGTMSTCTAIGLNPSAIGVLSAAGNITAGFIVMLRCPFGRGTIDYKYTSSFTLSRR